MKDAFLQDLRYAVRKLAAAPGFTAIAILSLALGVGATTTMFSIVDAVDFRPLPFVDPQRLVTLHEVAPAGSRACAGPIGCLSQMVATPTLDDWAAQSSALEGVATYGIGGYRRWRRGAESEPITAAAVSGNIFSVLGVRPLLGRTFLPSELRPEGDPVVILSYAFWHARFADDPKILGSRMTIVDLNRRQEFTMTVVGVMPRGFGLLSEQVWIPTKPFGHGAVPSRTNRNVIAIGRLAPGRTIAQARTEAKTIAARIAAAYPATNTGRSADVLPLDGTGLLKFWAPGADNAGRGRFMLFGVVALVLFVATLDVAALLLVRSRARRYELSVRSALGATRARLIRQLVLECLSLAAGGGALGVVIAWWGVRAASGALSLDLFGIPIGVDTRVLGFAIAVSVVSGLASSVIPAIQVSRFDLTLRERATGAAGAGRASWTQSALVITEIACALVLLTGAGLLSRELLRLRYVEPGYDPRQLYAFTTSLPPEAIGSPERQERIARQALDGVRGAPGVVIASLEAPSFDRVSSIPGYMDSLPAEMHGPMMAVGPEFFRTVGTGIVRGRAFETTDRVGAPPVAIVDETAAARYWRGANPIGKTIVVASDSSRTVLTVVGVASRSKLWMSSLTMAPFAQIYRPIAQDWGQQRQVVLLYARLSGNPAGTLSTVRSVLYRASGIAVDRTDIRSLEANIATELRQHRFDTMALGAFAIFGLLLAAMGIYGVVAYSVAQRTREIGIRIALGAERGSVLGLFVRHGAVLAVGGVIVGVAGSLVGTRILRSLLVGTSATDPIVFIASALLLLAVVLAATLVPARRATRVDPMIALRAD